MTATAVPPHAFPRLRLRAAAAAARAAGRSRACGCGAPRRSGVLWLLPVLVVGAVVHAWGMDNFPRWVDDPGTYLSQAWSVQYEHNLSPYSYFYDHAPAGWIQIALWSMLTGGFDRYDSAIGVRQRVHADREGRLDRPAVLARPPAALHPARRGRTGLRVRAQPARAGLHALDVPRQPRHAVDPAGLRAGALPAAHA